MSEPENQIVNVEHTSHDDGQDEEDAVFFVSLSYRGTSYDVPVQTGDSISSIFDFIQEALDFPRETCKLIHRGKVLRPNDVVTVGGKSGLTPGARLMLVATSARDLAYVQSSRADPLVKGFDDEERDERNRRKRARAGAMSAWGTKQDSEFCFASIKAEFKYSSPPPYEAEGLLRKLATDPGVIEIMKTRQFRVGILTEMSPAEAQERMKNKGTPNMDLLGYNQNYGEMIVLKLRTDNTKGFRPYHDLINTLLHEVTHNVWGPHDHNFWKLFGELKAQYMKFHQFWSHGGRAADSSASGQFSGFAAADDEDGAGASSGFGQALGGSSASASAPNELDRRRAAAAAAESRAIGSASGGFNFLASGGKPVLVCPCGLIHSPADCPTNGVPTIDEADEDDVDAIESAANKDPTSSDADGTSTDQVMNVAQEDEASPAGEPVGDTAEPTGAHSEDAMAPLPMDVDAAESAAMPVDVLSLEDLAALGLDGASEWLERFSVRLTGLCNQKSWPAAREGLELLLRLVRNVVTSPLEPRFRRIRAANPKIRSSLLEAGPDAEALMALLGFEPVNENGERVFVLRDAVLDTARLRLGQELLEQRLLGAAICAH